MLLRQVQARPLQGHRLRALRRGGHALQGAARAHGSRGPGGARLPHLVLQGRAVADRLPDRHGSEGAREGPLLRGVDGHVGRRRGAREGRAQAGEGSPEGHRLLRGREGGPGARAARVARPPAGLPAHRQADELLRRGPSVGRRARREHQEALRRRPREAREGAHQDVRVGHLRHRGLHRGRGRAHAPDLGALPGDEAQGRDRGRDAVPRAQGSLRLPVRLRRVLPRRHGRRVRARPAAAGGPRRGAGRAGGPGQDRQGPEAEPRGQAAQGRVGLHPLRQQARGHGPRGRAGHPAGAAAHGAAGRRPLRHLGPQRSLPPGDQPQQPAQAPARPGRARDHREQREADAPGGRRRAVRQRPPRAPRHGPRQPAPQVAQRHAQGQAGPLPPEPARQARGLLGPLGHRGRPEPAPAPVRPAQAHGPRAVQAVHHGPARRAQVGPEHQGRQEDGRLDDPRGLGRPRGGHQGPSGAPEPRAHPAPPGAPGLRAGAGGGQGDPGAPAGVPRLQRRLRRRPDGRAPAAVRRGPGRGAAADAVGQQHPVPGARRAAGHAHAGHGAGRLLPDLRPERGGPRGTRAEAAGGQVGREEGRRAPARVPFRAGGRALLRAQHGQAARPGRVPAGARPGPRADHRGPDHLQRAHRARARGGARGHATTRRPATRS